MSAQQYYQFPEDHDEQLKVFLRRFAIAFALFAVFLGSMIYYADKLLVFIPFSAEQKFIRPYEELFAKYWQDEKIDLQAQAYLQDLGEQLATQINLGDDIHIKVHLVNADEQNAFATLGGHIVIFTGLINNLPDENSLAMVLAHEIAHIKQRDPIVSLGRGAMVQLLYALVTGNSGSFDGLFSSGSEVGMLFFSREQESQADLLALEALAKHYGHVAGSTTFFRQMLQAHNDEMPAWLSSHPKLQQRINVINQRIQVRGWRIKKATKMPPELLFE